MEPPRSTNAEAISQKELDQLLIRLSSLPPELAVPFLYQLSYRQLISICLGAKKTQSSKLARLAFFCQDVNFWRDWLLENGYSLPETLPELLDILQKVKETDLTILKKIFFSEDSPMISRRLIKLWQDFHEEGVEGVTEEELEQAVLDLDYINEQVEDRALRQKTQRPRVFEIKLFTVARELPLKISYDDLLQLLVDGNMTDNLIYGIEGLTFRTVLFSGESFLRKQAKLEYPELGQRMAEQRLAQMSSLIRKGDLIKVIFNRQPLWNGIQYYFVSDNKFLVKIVHLDIENGSYFFPEESMRFLSKNDVTIADDLGKLYPSFRGRSGLGYIEKGKGYFFP